MEAAREVFATETRADLAIGVTVTDAADATVFEGTFDYALRPRKP